MELKEIIEIVSKFDIWHYRVLDFRKHRSINSNSYSVEFLSNDNNVSFEVRKDVVHISFNKKYDSSYLYLLKELRKHFPNHILKQKVYE